ncbi:hypothetical protein D3C80_1740820 [compost metagenome]
MIRQGQPDGPCRPVPDTGQAFNLLFDLGQARRDRLKQTFAGCRGSHAARRAGQQPDAETRFKLPDGMAERGLSHADPGGGFREAALLGDDLEPGQLVQVRSRHAWLPRLIVCID